MRTFKVMVHTFFLMILFLFITIMVNPLTDDIRSDTVRVLVKESVRIGMTISFFSLYSKKFFHKSIRYFRIKKFSNVGARWYLLGVTMPVLIVVFYVATEYASIHFQLPRNGILFTYIIQSFIIAAAAAVIEEFLFRGYLFKIIEDRWNVLIAIISTSFLFSTLHLLSINSGQLIDVIFLLTGGMLVGVMFSVIVYKTGNVWNAVVVHFIWNFFMSSKVVQFVPNTAETPLSIILLKLKTESPWLTGGSMGVETALPAVFMYFLIVCLVSLRKTKEGNKSIFY